MKKEGLQICLTKTKIQIKLKVQYKIFMSECEKLKRYEEIQNKLINVDMHASPILGTKKPDILFILIDLCLDMLNAVVIGEIEKKVDENFSILSTSYSQLN